MGLPVWPSSPTSSKDAIKVDITASARSPIRRNAQPRRAHAASPHPRAAPAASNTTNTTTTGTRRSPRRERSHLGEPIPRHYGAPFRVPRADDTSDSAESSASTSAPLPPAPESRNYRIPAPAAPFMRRERDERDYLHVLRYPLPYIPPQYAPSTRPREDVTNERPRPSLDDTEARHEILRNRSHDDDGNPYAPGEVQRYMDRVILTGPVPPPSARPVRAVSSNPPDGPVSDDDSYRLHRVSARSDYRYRPSPLRDEIDGLGDRDREHALSPDDESGSEDEDMRDSAWDTMLATITPDERLPSADSSFSAAAAAASFSAASTSGTGSTTRSVSDASNSVNSSRTHITLPDEVVEVDEYRDELVCDVNEDGDVVFSALRSGDRPNPRRALASWADAEDETRWEAVVSDELRTWTERQRRNVRARYDAGMSASRIIPETDAEARAEEREQRLAGFRAGVPPTREQTGRAMAVLEGELEGGALEAVRMLVERLVRRGDIADEWWIGVGLLPVGRRGQEGPGERV
ncbi:hypothetical protein EJ06DRAFT_549736 [Trichodelitschia bisporula]|uniref:Uncharacterized protein n=1 Tax=Trichodelitschia bisporula TaxID=703511 RepID=A0A6G1HSZ7_9PEZI|nr:hypothetical protein EJ06DRAFT_549736 [Trichodelitschia bisporula]